MTLKEIVKANGKFVWNECWIALTKNIPFFSTLKNPRDAMNYLFNTDSIAENNIRIIIQILQMKLPPLSMSHIKTILHVRIILPNGLRISLRLFHLQAVQLLMHGFLI